MGLPDFKHLVVDSRMAPLYELADTQCGAIERKLKCQQILSKDEEKALEIELCLRGFVEGSCALKQTFPKSFPDKVELSYETTRLFKYGYATRTAAITPSALERLWKVCQEIGSGKFPVANEFKAKYVAQKFGVAGPKKGDSRTIVADHITPTAVMKELLFKVDELEPDGGFRNTKYLKQVIRFGATCLITHEENNSLPECSVKSSDTDVGTWFWSRYDAAGIKPYFIKPSVAGMCGFLGNSDAVMQRICKKAIKQCKSFDEFVKFWVG